MNNRKKPPTKRPTQRDLTSYLGITKKARNDDPQKETLSQEQKQQKETTTHTTLSQEKPTVSAAVEVDIHHQPAEHYYERLSDSEEQLSPMTAELPTTAEEVSDKIQATGLSPMQQHQQKDTLIRHTEDDEITS